MAGKGGDITRRRVLKTAFAAAALAGVGFPAWIRARNRELLIERIQIQETRGRRLTPVAPNARGGQRPDVPERAYECRERVLRIRTAQGIEGVGPFPGRVNPETLRKLVGLDPFKLFQFGAKDRILGRAAEHEAFLAEIRGCDIALLDLIGKALERPIAALLGDPVRDSVLAYDSTLYMEDFLAPAERQNLKYIHGELPSDPVELIVRKAHWVVNERAEGFRAVKIKVGRGKLMGSVEAALPRDIAVTNAIRSAVGQVRILVDGNRGFTERPMLAFDYAQGVAAANVYFMEEMFPEEDIANTQELKKRLRAANSPIKLAAGESHVGGIPENVYTQRFVAGKTNEPLIDVEQGDMNQNGFLHLRSKAATQSKLGMTCAPHNFGSKLGFCSQIHLGTVVPNWDCSETDDSQFPAVVAEGVAVKQGFARLTGAPGLGVRLVEEHLQKPIVEI